MGKRKSEWTVSLIPSNGLLSRICFLTPSCAQLGTIARGEESELQRQKTDVGRCWGVAELIVPASGLHELLSYSKLTCLVNALFKKHYNPPFIF